MLNFDEGKTATLFARDVIESHLLKTKQNNPTLSIVFQEKRGVFVTIHSYPDHELRGCIGIPYPVMSLKSAIIEAASSVIRDPRFLPLTEKELNHILVEITILTKPQPLKVMKPELYPQHINIGKDGLIINHRGRSGLLLPQVPVEQGWNAEDFLTHICLKAGLPPDAWFEEDADIQTFSGQIFTEILPNGAIEEKTLDDI